MHEKHAQNLSLSKTETPVNKIHSTRPQQDLQSSVTEMEKLRETPAAHTHSQFINLTHISAGVSQQQAGHSDHMRPYRRVLMRPALNPSANQTPWVLRTILTVEHDGSVKLWRFMSTEKDGLITAKPCGEMWCNAQNHFQQATGLKHPAEETGRQKWPAIEPRLGQNSIRLILTFLHKNALTMPKNLLICEMITGRHCLNKTMQHNEVMLHWRNILPLKDKNVCMQ